MILITGGAGFIGSALVWGFNEHGYREIVVLDRLGLGDKWKNLAKRQVNYVVPKDQFHTWLDVEQHPSIQAVFHLGACSSTTERDADYLMDNNVLFTKRLWDYCAAQRIPFFYASSAATYGSEEEKFLDSHESIESLRPINKYGWSKQLFDAWAIRQQKAPPHWFGFKFFNVYGPQEYHKGPQSSVVYHAFPQVRDHNQLRLFKSHRQDVEHGNQRRDFVYIKDVIKVLLHFHHNYKQIPSGIYNLGSGQARSFADLGKAVFQALEKPSRFEWIDMPESLQKQYQYFTQADQTKLREKANYKEAFYTLEDGVRDYVCNYLNREDPYL
jgi:ADP-L-glycero-D-manno-heptose 6-epimerase